MKLRTVILHNYFDRVSREFVDRHGSEAEVYDWYRGGREEWLAEGGAPYVSAFPTVVFISGSRQHIVRLPASLNEAREELSGAWS